MSEEHKKRVKDALNKFYERKDKEFRRLVGLDAPRRKNEKPEKEVESQCVAWMLEQGWIVDIFEAKATFSRAAGRWVNAAMKAGVCDCLGTTPDGIAIAVEFKAPGKLSSFNRAERFRQRKFILDRINSNSFACVTDSVDRLKTIYEKWRELRAKGADFDETRSYLISMLPKKKENTGLETDSLFDDD